jgi:hypothetical protein
MAHGAADAILITIELAARRRAQPRVGGVAVRRVVFVVVRTPKAPTPWRALLAERDCILSGVGCRIERR